MKKISLLLLLVGTLFFLSVSTRTASAQIPVEMTDDASPKVTVRLLAENSHIVPGKPFVVALEQVIAPKWHTYWLNPGDSGFETTLTWELPAGFTASPIDWPTPSALPFEGLVNYGYEGTILLPVTITPPENLASGEGVTLKARADWLVCHDICLPESAELSIELPVSVDSEKPVLANLASFAAMRAKMPEKLENAATWHQNGNDFILTLADAPTGEAQFFPATNGVIRHAAPQIAQMQNGTLVLTIPRPGDAAEIPAQLAGIVKISDKGYAITAKAAPPPASTDSDIPAKGAAGLWAALLFAALGGMILNLMPCVFPVLSIKALSLIHHADATPRTVRVGGLVYALGVCVTFVAMAAILIALKAAGSAIGWGFQLQSTPVILVLACIMFAVALNLSGVFHFGDGLMGIGSGWTSRHGHAASFFTGILAVIVAAPCTAPFMATALGYALVQPPAIALSVFLALGLGMALPYVLVCFSPGIIKCLPRPGIWLDRFKQACAFPMYGATAWLIWVAARQGGEMAVAAGLSSLLLLGFSLWVLQISRSATTRKGRIIARFFALAGFVCLIGSFYSAQPPQNSIEWQTWRAEAVQSARDDGKPVFINATAAWCTSCLVNDRLAINRAETVKLFQQKQVVAFKADWTKRDAAITALLKEHDRAGVPLYLYYPANSEQAVILPQLLTPEIIRNHLVKQP